MGYVHACSFVCEYYCMLNLSKKLPQLFVKIFDCQVAWIMLRARLLVFLGGKGEGGKPL